MNHRAVAALSCALLAAAIAAAAAAPTPRPHANTPSPAPSRTSSSSGSIVSSGPAQTRFGDLTVNFSEGEGNLKTGDFVMPSTVTGHSSDGTFRGDRAFGNSKRDEVTLIGHVLVHKLGGVGGNGKKPSEPVTLTCDKLQIYSKRKVYIATGNVKVVQGDKTLTAPLMRLDDQSHDAALTGGVHAEEPPDRTFDAAEVLYNTKSENFKALGGVQATFPLKSSPTPAPPPPLATALPSGSAFPRVARPSPTPTHS